MWSNWAGNERSGLAPMRTTSLAELQSSITGTDGAVRIVGAGHSFTPLIAGGTQILDLADLAAPPVLAVHDDRARVNAAARLRDLSPALASHGVAFRNLGDINAQSLAGAASTATHGTGRGLPCLAAEITAAQLVTADGDIISTDDLPLEAVQVALGLLGVMIEAEIAVVPKYNLRRRVHLAPLEESLEDMHRHWEECRNFEFYYVPLTGKTIQIRDELTDAAETKPPLDLDMIGLRALKLARTAGRVNASLRRWLLSLVTLLQSDEDYVGESWKVLCSERSIRFKEMEYHLPPEVTQDVLTEVLARSDRDHPDVYFPIEVRQTAGDQAWLSPFQGGSRVSVALHTDANEPHEAYFDAMEPIFRAAGGRPHWGKMHSLAYRDLRDLYPDFNRFCALRAELDPKGRFLTPAMARLVME